MKKVRKHPAGICAICGGLTSSKYTAKTCRKCCMKRLREFNLAHGTGRNELSAFWKGENVGYGAVHTWVKRRKPKTALCEKCKIKPPYDLANISQQYKRDVNDYEWLCRKCHLLSDGRLKYLALGRMGKKQKHNGE